MTLDYLADLINLSCKSNRVFECGEVLRGLGEGAGVINYVAENF